MALLCLLGASPVGISGEGLLRWLFLFLVFLPAGVLFAGAVALRGWEKLYGGYEAFLRASPRPPATDLPPTTYREAPAENLAKQPRDWLLVLGVFLAALSLFAGVVDMILGPCLWILWWGGWGWLLSSVPLSLGLGQALVAWWLLKPRRGGLPVICLFLGAIRFALLLGGPGRGNDSGELEGVFFLAWWTCQVVGIGVLAGVFVFSVRLLHRRIAAFRVIGASLKFSRSLLVIGILLTLVGAWTASCEPRGYRERSRSTRTLGAAR